MGEPQIVIITGAARGIGYGIARRFAQQAASVVVADVNGEAAREAAVRLAEEGSIDPIGLSCDVAELKSLEAMIDAVVDHYGRLDVLINNAGICPFVHALELTPEQWQRSMEVNCNGPFYASQIFAKRLIAMERPGRILYITSLADSRTGPKQVDYAASKSGLRMLMAGMATALGPHGINCNAVAPGHVRTPLTQHHWDSAQGQAMIPEVIPLGRLGQPEDIGDACVFLASPQASYINGITLRVDGGNSVLNP